MKKLKKFLAMMISMVMVLSMATVGFATTGKQGSVEIGLSGTDKSASGNHTVNMYQILNLDSYKETKYSYSVNAKYSEVVKSVLQDLQVTVNDNTDIIAEILKLKDSDKLQTFANKFEETVSGRTDLTPEGTGIIDSSKGKSTTVENLNMGYYLVVLDNAKQIQANLVTIKDTGNNKITLKAETPSITKSADKFDAEIGEIVTYTIPVEIPKKLSDDMVYRITDTLSSGLDFVSFTDLDTEVTKGTLIIDVDGNTTPKEGITSIVGGKDGNNPRVLTIDLSEYIKNNQAQVGQTLTIKYKARVNANALVKENNSAKLEYGKNQNSIIENKPSEVKTPTFPIHINKVDDGNHILPGAKFELYRKDPTTVKEGNDPIKVTASDPDPKGIYKIDSKGSITEMETLGTEINNSNFGKNGGFNLVVNGLKAGTYWLKETKAPDGYNILKKPIKITITNNIENIGVDNDGYTISLEGAPEGVNIAPDNPNIIKIVNTTGQKLPETGGTGTLLLTAVGALLVAVAMIRFMRRKQEN